MSEITKFKAGDRIIVEGSLGPLGKYIEVNRLPFRWDDYNYRDNENCHSHVNLDMIRLLTPLEKLL